MTRSSALYLETTMLLVLLAWLVGGGVALLGKDQWVGLAYICVEAQGQLVRKAPGHKKTSFVMALSSWPVMFQTSYDSNKDPLYSGA
ncbi:hypothetical protein TNCV_2617391 [Trichonephila clavipes]|nr:hypothetical protein TNCV_2617391 [Trichonephila clavipes]